jgi:catechol 2,3-dioxygenase-like lactoylglutathione lyase family enzyme
MAINLDHVALSVSDVERSAKFYFKIFGFKYEPVALARVSASLVIQFINRPIEGSQHLAFAMDATDFERTLSRLKSAEIPYGDNFGTVGTMSGPGVSHGSEKNAACIYFKDPDGHMLEIMRYGVA